MKTPSDMQIALLQHIYDFTSENGYAPTMQEIADHYQRSRVTIFERVRALVGSGWMAYEPLKARAYTITPAGMDWVEIPAMLMPVGRLVATPNHPIEAFIPPEFVQTKAVPSKLESP